jgi:hypothetical protein
MAVAAVAACADAVDAHVSRRPPLRRSAVRHRSRRVRARTPWPTGRGGRACIKRGGGAGEVLVASPASMKLRPHTHRVQQTKKHAPRLGVRA